MEIIKLGLDKMHNSIFLVIKLLRHFQYLYYNDMLQKKKKKKKKKKIEKLDRNLACRAYYMLR